MLDGELPVSLLYIVAKYEGEENPKSSATTLADLPLFSNFVALEIFKCRKYLWTLKSACLENVCFKVDGLT